ncbi:MAG: lipopolysaccharide biosynthesis protein [Acidimicrobiales bacterium]
MSPEPTRNLKGNWFRRLWGAFDGLAEDTLWSALLDMMAVIAALVSFYLFMKALPLASYGKFAGLYGLVTTFSAITYSGPGLALIQRRLRFKQDLNEIQAAFLSLTILAGAVSSVLAVGLALLFIKLSFIEILLVTLSELFANSIILVCSWLVQAAIGFPAMIRVRMFAVLLKLVAVPALYFSDMLTIRNLGATYLVLYASFALWLIYFYLPRIGYTVRFRKPPVDAWRSSSVFAVPLAASQVQLDGDKVALNAFNLQGDAGLYAAAYRVVLLGTLPLRVIGQAAFHRFLPHGDDGGPGFYLRRSAQLTAFMFGIGVAVAAAMYAVLFFAEPLLDRLIEEEYSEAKDIIPWLVLFIPLLAISGTPTNGLLGLGRAKERAAVYLSSALLSVVLYVLLIPGRGWEGAVIATLTSETYLAVASWAAMIHYQRRADEERSELEVVEV